MDEPSASAKLVQLETSIFEPTWSVAGPCDILSAHRYRRILTVADGDKATEHLELLKIGGRILVGHTWTLASDPPCAHHS